jgi:hypothetical protein
LTWYVAFPIVQIVRSYEEEKPDALEAGYNLVVRADNQCFWLPARSSLNRLLKPFLGEVFADQREH